MNPPNYTAAIEELQSITSEIERDSVPVDELAARLRRAAELIQWCRAQLRSAEGEVNAVMDGLEGAE